MLFNTSVFLLSKFNFVIRTGHTLVKVELNVERIEFEKLDRVVNIGAIQSQVYVKLLTQTVSCSDRQGSLKSDSL